MVLDYIKKLVYDLYYYLLKSGRHEIIAHFNEHGCNVKFNYVRLGFNYIAKGIDIIKIMK